MKFGRVLKKTGRGIRRGFQAVWKRRKAIGKVILIVLGALLCLLPTIFLNTLLGYLPIFFYLLLLILGGAYLLILRANISCSSENAGYSCSRLEKGEFRICLKNRSPLVAPMVMARFFMKSANSNSGRDMEFMLALSPFETREFKFNVEFAHLGIYTVGISGLEIGGLLDLVKFRLPGGGMQQVEVTPLRHHPGYLALTDLVETEDSRARAAAPLDGFDYTGVREYAFGDPMKNIHWKLSAHSDAYMTKQTEILGNAGVDIIIDIVAPPWEGEDGAFMYDALIESACAVVLYARERGMENSVWFFDRTYAERNVTLASDESFNQLVDELPGITDNASAYQVDELLSHAASSQYAKNNVVLCTARADDAVIHRLEEIQVSRRHPAMIYVIPPGLNEREWEKRLAATKTLEQQNIPCHVISTVQELR